MTEPVESSFLGLSPEEQPTYEEAAVVLQPVPYEGTVSYAGGTAAGPKALVAASSQVELWDLELDREPWTVGIHLAPELAPLDRDPEQMADAVEAACLPAHTDGKLVFTLGGEHSVTVGAARAAARSTPEPLTFLVIDAHLNLRDRYDGTSYSHACTSRRLLELGRVVHVGVRTACPEELEVIEAHDLAPIWGHEVHAEPSSERWIARALDQLQGPVYVSVDVDGLDPSVIPATGTPVPGGLAWYDLLALLRAVGQRCKVVGCDLVELAPIPGQVASDFAAALLAYKMIGYFAPSTPNERLTTVGGAILVSAGEVSGNRIGAPVVAELRRALGQVELFGAGGPRLAAQGVEVRHSVDALAVTGVTEALRRSASAARLLLDMRQQIRRRRPRLGLLIDYPGLNLRLAALLRRYGVPVLHYVAPQRWAWMPWRAKALRGLVDRLAVTLPFEEDWFRRRGVPATFVGHPVVETFTPQTRAAALERLGLEESAEVVAVLPGSRDNEIRRLLPSMARSVRDLGSGLHP